MGQVFVVEEIEPRETDEHYPQHRAGEWGPEATAGLLKTGRPLLPVFLLKSFSVFGGLQA